LICCVVKADPNSGFVAGLVTRLLTLLDDSTTVSENLIHTINVLRAIVRDAEIPARNVEVWIAAVVNSALRILARLDDWKIRSAATQLFVQSARRLIGTDNESGSMSRKIVSANEFFFNRGCPELLKNFIAVLASNKEHVIVSTLAVLQSLAADLGQASPELIEQIQDLLWNSNSAPVRKLCGLILASARVEPRSGQWTLNRVHGYLCYLEQTPAVPKIDTTLTEYLSSLRSPIPALIRNQLLRIGFTSINFTPSEIRSFISTEPTERTRDPQFRRLVNQHCLAEAAHPVFREYLAGSAEDVANSLWETWTATEYFLGAATLLERVDPDTACAWLDTLDTMKVYNSLCDDTKVQIAKSGLSSPSLRLRLVADISVEVRSADLSGRNAVSMVRELVGGMNSTKGLRELAENTECFAILRRIASEELGRR
jgi:hypothetical protein